MIGGTDPAADGADGEGVVRSSMGIPDLHSSALSGEAVGHLTARVKAQAMRRATRCSDQRRVGTIVGALMMLGSGAYAGDTNALAPTAPHAAACAHAATFRTVVDVGHGTQAPGALSAR